MTLGIFGSANQLSHNAAGNMCSLHNAITQVMVPKDFQCFRTKTNELAADWQMRVYRLALFLQNNYIFARRFYNYSVIANAISSGLY